MDGFGEVLDVVGVHASHGDAARAEEVDVELLNKSVNLRLGEASVGEHANLQE